MDIEFYEIPGLNRYLCANEMVLNNSAWTRAAGKDDMTYLFTELNEHFDNNEVDHVTLYTTEKSTFSHDLFTKGIENLKEQYSQTMIDKGLYAVVVGAVGVLTVSPLIGGVGALFGAQAYNAYQTSKAIDTFQENAGHINVNVSDDLVELNQLYSELNFEEKVEEYGRIQSELSFWERHFWPNKEHRAQLNLIRDEVIDGLKTMSKKAEHIAFEKDQIAFLDISRAYNDFAEGASLGFIVPKSNYIPGWDPPATK